MSEHSYESFKTMANMFNIPASVLQVHKNDDGTVGEIIMYAINSTLENSSKKLFTSDGSTLEIEGQPYYSFMPKEPKFDDICYKAAFLNRHNHAYIDTTRMYGYWTENIVIPLGHPEDNIGYCLFMYTLNHEMDTGKYSAVPPDIASFVIKTCLTLRNEDFQTAMNIAVREIREYTDSFCTCIMTVTPDQYKFNVVSESVRNGALSIKEIFEDIPYEIVETWEWLVADTNDIIIKDESDMAFYELKAPEWVATLRMNDVENLVLVPFMHQNAIIGYLYICNFNIENLAKAKETLELVSLFLSAETANHLIMDRLEYLSNIDMLTGVYNRNSMNVNVDELSTKLKLNPRPFSVAFCDLNGLKSINDNDGHNDGDRLLKEAANVLKEVFEGDKIFRAGGDEFVVISLDSTEQEFLEKIGRLRSRACDPDWLYFAIGYYHDPSMGDLRLALRYADERMYKDKDAYYDAHPEKRR